MNLKQKRKLLKQTHPPKETFTREEAEDFARDFARKVIQDYLAATMMVLRDHLEFGGKRIEAFLIKVSEQTLMMSEKLYSADDAFTQIHLETKFDLNGFINKRAEEVK